MNIKLSDIYNLNISNEIFTKSTENNYVIDFDMDLTNDEMLILILDIDGQGDYYPNVFIRLFLIECKKRNLLKNPIESINYTYNIFLVEHYVLLFHEEFEGDLVDFLLKDFESVIVKLQYLFFEYNYINENNIFKFDNSINLVNIINLYNRTHNEVVMDIIIRRIFEQHDQKYLDEMIFNFCVDHDLFPRLQITKRFKGKQLPSLFQNLLLYEYEENKLKRMRISEFDFHHIVHFTDYKKIADHVDNFAHIIKYTSGLRSLSEYGIIRNFLIYLRDSTKFRHHMTIEYILDWSNVFEEIEILKYFIQLYDGKQNIMYDKINELNQLFMLYDVIEEYYGNIYSEKSYIFFMKNIMDNYNDYSHKFYQWIYNKIEDKSILEQFPENKFIYSKLSCDAKQFKSTCK